MVVASGVLLAIVPASAKPHPTDPAADPGVVYPYVEGGRPDAAAITFTHVPHPILSVYDLSDRLLFRRPIHRSAFWNPRRDGDVLGTDLTDDEGRSFRVCVTRRGMETIGSRNCTKVRVVHVREDTEVSRKRVGRVYASKTVDAGCRVRRHDLAVSVACDAGATAVLRYEMERPSLASEESFLGRASFEWKGRYYHWGDGIGLKRTIRGANVIAAGGFSGKLSWLTKIWIVRTEY